MMQYRYVGMSDLKSMFRYKSSKKAKMSKFHSFYVKLTYTLLAYNDQIQT